MATGRRGVHHANLFVAKLPITFRISVIADLLYPEVELVAYPNRSIFHTHGGASAAAPELLMRNSSINATSHHDIAIAINDHAVYRHHTRFGWWQAHQITADRQPANVAMASPGSEWFTSQRRAPFGAALAYHAGSR